MPHERRVQRGVPPQAAQTGEVSTSRSERPVPQNQIFNALSQTQSDIRALNSSVLILSQKMQYLVRNEKILGRNLIVLSKRIREIEATGISASSTGALSPASTEQLSEISARIESMGQKLLNIQNEVEDIKEHYAKNETLKEMKYLVDTINPLDFVTLKQFNELFDQKMKKKK